MENEAIIIRCVSEYIDQFALQGGTNFHNRNTRIMPIFRGQADKDWDLIPSIYRDNRFKFETLYLQELERICPEEFVGLSYIEKMIEMQHHGLPTRLLDFSLNPLVALYFACKGCMDSDGVVYAVHGFPLHPENFVWTSIVMKAIFEYTLTNFPLEEFLDDIKNDSKNYPCHDVEPFCTKGELIKILTNPIGIYPRLNNSRIRNQDGVFILFGMSISSNAHGKQKFDGVTYKIPEVLSKHTQTCYIPAECKIAILRELDHLGVNERKLFPDIDSMAKYIPSYFENRKW